MPTSQKATRATRPSSTPYDPLTLDTPFFHRGYQSGTQAAGMELRQRCAPHSAELIYAFIQIRLDPEHIQRQRDVDKNPFPPAYHAGFVAGYLATLFVPDSQEVAR